MTISSVRLSASQWPPLTLYWPLCRVPTDTDGPIDLRTAHAFEIARPLGGPCLSPSHHARRDKGLPDMKSCRPKVWAEEERRRKEGKNGGSLSCGALPLKASWPAICAGSLAIATTPGRERGERQQGRGSQGWSEGGKDGGEEGEETGNMRQDGVDAKSKARGIDWGGG